MHEKQIRFLASQIAKQKTEKGKSPRLSQNIWDQITELRPHFTLIELADRLGISPGNLHKRTFKRNSLKKNSVSPLTTLIPISSLGTTIPQSTSGTPVFEMELPSGVKIRIYS